MDGDGGRGEVTVDEDTCSGDSGGPMIIRKSASPSEDLQVRTGFARVLLFVCVCVRRGEANAPPRNPPIIYPEHYLKRIVRLFLCSFPRNALSLSFQVGIVSWGIGCASVSGSII